MGDGRSRGRAGGRYMGHFVEKAQREKDVSLDGNGEQGGSGTFSSKKVDYNNYHDDGTDSSQHDHHLAVFPPILSL